MASSITRFDIKKFDGKNDFGLWKIKMRALMILMLLTSLPSSYENFIETLLYRMESLIMEDVLATLNSRELKKKTKGIKEETGNGLYVRGRGSSEERLSNEEVKWVRQEGRVPFERRDERPAQPRVVYLPILDINYFCHFLDILENYNPMDDEPRWAADRVDALTLGAAITIPETTNKFAIKEIRAFSEHENETLTDAWLRMKEMLRNCHGHNLTKGNIIKVFYHGLNKITQEDLNYAAGGIFLYKTPNQAYQLLEDKVLLKLDWAKNPKTKSSLKKTIAFADEGSSNSDTNKIMARMDAMTMKMDAQYKELQSRSNNSNSDCNDDDIPMSREEEAKFMQTFRRTCFYNDYRDCDLNHDNWRSSGRNDYNQDNYQSNSDDKPDLQRQLSKFIKAQQSTNSFVKDMFMDLKTKLKTTTKNHQASIQNLEAKFDRFADKQSGRPSRSPPSSTCES
ncbi:hypothetical protein Tco_1109895 [Tanacetum coccineum]|uniref:Retrotransposon gag domain-containing protein n=1 Tax=Tanacetum coccineum TaxID=301880 RepID=A0ABQ5IH85_9ASTR